MASARGEAALLWASSARRSAPRRPDPLRHPRGRRLERVAHVQAHQGVSRRRGCVALGFERSSIRYRSTRSDQTPLHMRIRDLARTRVRYGYFRIYILLRREGWWVNHKRVHRLYREEGLSLRLKRPRRHVSAVHRERRPPAV